MTRGIVFAAGGVLWRGDPDCPELALVHRPTHDDWSLPKGKSEPGEHVLVTALREVAEETGHRARIGPRLATIRYPARSGRRRVEKVVSYWSMRATGGCFVPSREVDEIAWLSLPDARREVTSESDRRVLRAFAKLPRATDPLLLIRNGATSEAARDGAGEPPQRLNRAGRLRAAALAPVLEELRVSGLLSADVPACVDTLKPAETATGLTVHPDRRLAREAFAGIDRDTADRLYQGASQSGGLAVCAQRPVLAALFRALSGDAMTRLARDMPQKGGWWLLHCGQGRVMAYESFKPAA